jgi:hypothetical protein
MPGARVSVEWSTTTREPIYSAQRVDARQDRETPLQDGPVFAPGLLALSINVARSVQSLVAESDFDLAEPSQGKKYAPFGLIWIC